MVPHHRHHHQSSSSSSAAAAANIFIIMSLPYQKIDDKYISTLSAISCFDLLQQTSVIFHPLAAVCFPRTILSPVQWKDCCFAPIVIKPIWNHNNLGWICGLRINNKTPSLSLISTNESNIESCPVSKVHPSILTFPLPSPYHFPSPDDL